MKGPCPAADKRLGKAGILGVGLIRVFLQNRER